MITFLVQQKGSAVSSLENLSIKDRFANALVSYAGYLGKLFWPVKLADSCELSRPPVILPLGEVLGAASLLLRLFKAQWSGRSLAKKATRRCWLAGSGL